MIRVQLVEDDPMVRAGVRAILAAAEDIGDHGPVAQHELLRHDCVGFNRANHWLAIHTAT